MLIAIHVAHLNGQYQAIAPDFPDCVATDSDIGSTLARVHLAVEVHIGALLATREDLPTIRTLAELRQTSEFSSGQLFEVYVEDHQLAAMAIHQAGK